MSSPETSEVFPLKIEKSFNKSVLNQCKMVSLLCTLVLPQTVLSAFDEISHTEESVKKIDFTPFIYENTGEFDTKNTKISESFRKLFLINNRLLDVSDEFVPHMEISSYSLEAYLIDDERTAKGVIKLGGMFLKEFKEWIFYKIPELKKIEYIAKSAQTPFSVSNDKEMQFFKSPNSNALLKLKLNPKVEKIGNQYELSSNSSISLEFYPDDYSLDYSIFITKDGVVGLGINGTF